jgi:hypothetical protein
MQKEKEQTMVYQKSHENDEGYAIENSVGGRYSMKRAGMTE